MILHNPVSKAKGSLFSQKIPAGAVAIAIAVLLAAALTVALFVKLPSSEGKVGIIFDGAGACAARVLLLAPVAADVNLTLSCLTRTSPT